MAVLPTFSGRNFPSRFFVTKDEWESLCADVRQRMAAHVYPFVTPISATEDLTRGWVHGTGNYLSIGKQRFIVTAGHVVEDAEGVHLCHLPGPTDAFVLCPSLMLVDPWPVDAALGKLGAEWGTASKEAIPKSWIARRLNPVPDELFFFMGFPGSTAARNEPITDLNRRYNWGGGLLTSPCVPFVMQAPRERLPALEDYEPTKHVALHYPAKASSGPGMPEVDLPNPKGLSGSFLWDTKRVAALSRGRQWTPNEARVCGIIWQAHTKPEIVVATRIEFVRPLLCRTNPLSNALQMSCDLASSVFRHSRSAN